jgi:hypothetical protein
MDQMHPTVLIFHVHGGHRKFLEHWMPQVGVLQFSVKGLVFKKFPLVSPPPPPPVGEW